MPSPPEYSSPESPLFESLSSKSSSPDSNSTESPSSESPRSTPQPSQFVDRGSKVQVWVDALVENGGPDSGRGRGSPILCDSLLDIDSSQDCDIDRLFKFHNKMSNSSSSSARPSGTPGIQIRAMNISDGSPLFLCKTTLRIVPPQDFSSISATLIQAINTQALSEKSSCIGDISIFIHWAGETPDKYAYQTASRCWNNISLDLMLLSKKKFSTDSPDELKDLWIFLAERKYRDEIFCVFETSPTPPPDCTSEPENDIERVIGYSP